MLALVVGILETKKRKEELPRKENTTHPIYRSDLQELLMISWKTNAFALLESFGC